MPKRTRVIIRALACVNTERDFIGIELDKNYFEIAQSRIKNSMLSKRQ